MTREITDQGAQLVISVVPLHSQHQHSTNIALKCICTIAAEQFRIIRLRIVRTRVRNKAYCHLHIEKRESAKNRYVYLFSLLFVLKRVLAFWYDCVKRINRNIVCFPISLNSCHVGSSLSFG